MCWTNLKKNPRNLTRYRRERWPWARYAYALTCCSSFFLINSHELYCWCGDRNSNQKKKQFSSFSFLFFFQIFTVCKKGDGARKRRKKGRQFRSALFRFYEFLFLFKFLVIVCQLCLNYNKSKMGVEII
jgi:hypothetical protein